MRKLRERKENKRAFKESGAFQCLVLFWEFFKMGLFTIGGGMAMIPQIQQVAVKDRRWLSEEEMIDCIALCQSLPGVIAINSATYIGRRVKGIKGSLSATLGVVMPSFIIIILAVTFLGAIGDNRYITGAFTGIKAAVSGLIAVTAVKLGRQSLTSPFQWILAAAAFIAIAVFGVTALWAVLGGAMAGIIYTAAKKGREAEK
ncbi:MAG TPA: chromate transporter [Candidatus Copromorpha excrementigallinarum]|uniref:Chromate transporter n=1 Tax=Candidatus Allocopromorpha excrementigallinarum TaxID=2840742 RepID=A0A9D1I0X6_9FIRM|nr:chromate transporter [Candidatus Copromorpha excrementigallinarum]